MRVALVTLNASYSHTSSALRCLGAALQKQGIDTVRIERTLKDKHLSVLAALIAAEADVYGFSTYIWNVKEHLVLAAKLKAVRPEVTVVFGGPEVSYEDEDFLERHRYIDFVIAGEGEESLPTLIRELTDKGRDARRTEGAWIRSEPYLAFLEDGVAYSSDTDRPIAYYESSRGCPFTCSYCLSAAEIGVRAKPAVRVLEELKIFETMPAVKVVKFIDRTFNFDSKRACAIWKGLLCDCYTKTYHFEIAAARIDEETLALLARFPKGKIRLEAGVQSTNPDTLRAIRRSEDAGACLMALKKLHALGNIHIHADLIAGLPYEDFTRFAESFDAVYPACDVLQLGFLKLLKGTPLQREAEAYRIVASPEPPYEVLKTDWLSFEDLLRLHRVEAVLERFGNSGHFAETLAMLWRKGIGPFAFFDGLAVHMPEPETVSQLAAIRTLWEYCLSLPEVEREELVGRLRLDFYRHESGSCPAFLAGGELPVIPIRRSFCLQQAKGYPSASTEVHRFTFDPEGYYVIDRKEHRSMRVRCDL